MTATLPSALQSGPASLGIGLGVKFDPAGSATPVVDANFALPSSTSAGAYGFASAADAALVLKWCQTMDAAMKALKIISAS